MFAMLFDPSPYLAIIFLLGGTIFFITIFLIFFRTIFCCAGRMFVNGSWAAAWTYTPEAYPTVVRATGLGAANGLSKVKLSRLSAAKSINSNINHFSLPAYSHLTFQLYC